MPFLSISFTTLFLIFLIPGTSYIWNSSISSYISIDCIVSSFEYSFLDTISTYTLNKISTNLKCIGILPLQKIG